MQLMMMMMVGELAMSYCNPIGCHGRTCFETGTTINRRINLCTSYLFLGRGIHEMFIYFIIKCVSSWVQYFVDMCISQWDWWGIALWPRDIVIPLGRWKLFSQIVTLRHQDHCLQCVRHAQCTVKLVDICPMMYVHTKTALRAPLTVAGVTAATAADWIVKVHNTLFCFKLHGCV